MNRLGCAWTVGTVALIASLCPWGLARGQSNPTAKDEAGGETIKTIDAEYSRELTRLENRRLDRLARLAGDQDREQADQTYDVYFHRAIDAGLYQAAEPTAEQVLRSGAASPQVRFLAEVVNLMAEANRGAYEDSLNSLKAALQTADDEPGEAHPRAQQLPRATRLSLLEAYYQRLVQGEQYDVARRAFQLLRDRSQDPEIQQYLTNHLKRLDMIGQPAPPIAGTDLDGQPVSLADFHGDVVLVEFWASWCLPNAAEVEWFQQVERSYRDRGFRVLGINLDPLQDGGQDADTVLPNIRRFLLDHNVSWPNLLNGAGDRDFAQAYGITEIPANVLIGRDGNILQLDLTRSTLEKDITEALGP